jgi:hypothetical protein
MSSLFLLTTFLWLTTTLPGPPPVALSASPQSAQIATNYDEGKDLTTVSLPPFQVSGEKDEYYSLHVATSFDYPGHVFQPPEFLRFEIRSVVKRRKLNADLYVVFLVDGETIHLSSNRWAVKNPVRGKSWIGERMVFRMPYDTFIKLTKAKLVAIRMGGARFDLTERSLQRLRDFQLYVPQN